MRRQALALLARREHSRAELKAKLERRGGTAEDVEGLLDTLISDGQLSDSRYAETYARQRAEKGYGPVRIANELRKRGIEALPAQIAIDAVEGRWLDRARQVRVKRFGSAEARSMEERARQMRFLEYRGFAGDDVRRAVRAPDDE